MIFNSVDKIHTDVNPMPRFFNQFEDVTKAEVDAHDKLKQQLLNSSTQAVKSVLNQTMISGNLDREVSMFCPSVNGAGCSLQFDWRKLNKCVFCFRSF